MGITPVQITGVLVSLSFEFFVSLPLSWGSLPQIQLERESGERWDLPNGFGHIPANKRFWGILG